MRPARRARTRCVCSMPFLGWIGRVQRRATLSSCGARRPPAIICSVGLQLSDRRGDLLEIPSEGLGRSMEEGDGRKRGPISPLSSVRIYCAASTTSQLLLRARPATRMASGQVIHRLGDRIAWRKRADEALTEALETRRRAEGSRIVGIACRSGSVAICTRARS